jgi:hypothetical protein
MQSILNSDRTARPGEDAQIIEVHYLAACQHAYGHEEHVLFIGSADSLSETEVLAWLAAQETALVPNNIHVWSHPSRSNCVLGLIEYSPPSRLQ